MPEGNSQPIIIYDDRELVQTPLAAIVGPRGFGSIRVRNQTLADRFKRSLPVWARDRLTHLESLPNTVSPHSALPDLYGASNVILIAARGAVIDAHGLKHQIERLALTDRAIVDRGRRPLIRAFTSVASFLDHWDAFVSAPLHLNPKELRESETLTGPPCLVDISDRASFLDFIAGATAPREFNQVKIESLTYTKRSKDKQKLRAEHDYYDLIPASMKPWMVGAYNFQEDGDYAQYEMPRRFYADAAIQWVHSAWDIDTFNRFLDRILAFLEARPKKRVQAHEIEKISRELYIEKVRARREQLMRSTRGSRALKLIAGGENGEQLLNSYDRYFDFLEQHWKHLTASSDLVIGHGDPCLSNILYDDNSLTLQLIDPKGARSNEELWAHEFYDYAKLSHSILGEYDFINNGLFDTKIDQDGRIFVELKRRSRVEFKSIFEQRVSKVIGLQTLRLIEVSLFLSMVPLHLDHIDKVAAFLIRADAILTELEGGKYAR